MAVSHLNVFAIEISYWAEENAENGWLGAVVQNVWGPDDKTVSGYFRNAENGSGWYFRSTPDDLKGVVKTPAISDEVIFPGAFWLSRESSSSDLESEDTLLLEFSEKPHTLKTAFPGEEVSFHRVATQRLRKKEKLIPNTRKGEDFVTQADNVPLNMTSYEIMFTDPSYFPLETKLAAIIAAKQKAALPWALKRQKEVPASYFDHNVIPSILEYTPQRVLVLIYETHRVTFLSTSVKVSSVCFEKKESEWEEVSLAPANLSHLHPEPITNGMEGYEIMQPDLEPCAWLPQNIGLWSPGYQNSGIFGVMAAKFVKPKS